MRYEPYWWRDLVVSAYIVAVGFGEVGSVKGGTEAEGQLAGHHDTNHSSTFERGRRVDGTCRINHDPSSERPKASS
jgi:hypothetical protein